MVTRKILSLLTALFLVFGLALSAHAVLIDNLDGTVTQIRNDGSSLMWLKDANAAYTSGYDADGYMTWYESNTWIASLNSSNYLGHNDWRLPDTLPVNGSTYNYNLSYNGSTDYGYNISAPGSAYPGSTGSEMAYMYYVELGNLGYYDTTGNYQPGWGLTNTGSFTNLQPGVYWSGTEFASNPSVAWDFYFSDGGQYDGNKDFGGYYAWAVRPGPAAVPEPGTLLLLGTGLSVMVHWRKRSRRLHG